MIVRWSLLCLLLGQALALAQWTRRLNMNHGSWTDYSPARDLAYFRVDPCLRTDPADRFLQCSRKPTEEQLQHMHKTRTELRFIGKVGSFTIYDVEYYFHQRPFPEPGVKSVLVEESPDKVHEIYAQESFPMETIFPTEIRRVGKEWVIRVTSQQVALDRSIGENCFTISRQGVTYLDLEPIYEAAKKAVPAGSQLFLRAREIDWRVPKFRVLTTNRQGNAAQDCCTGRLELPFTIENGRVVIGKPAYFSDPTLE